MGGNVKPSVAYAATAAAPRILLVAPHQKAERQDDQGQVLGGQTARPPESIDQ